MSKKIKKQFVNYLDEKYEIPSTQDILSKINIQDSKKVEIATEPKKHNWFFKFAIAYSSVVLILGICAFIVAGVAINDSSSSNTTNLTVEDVEYFQNEESVTNLMTIGMFKDEGLVITIYKGSSLNDNSEVYCYKIVKKEFKTNIDIASYNITIEVNGTMNEITDLLGVLSFNENYENTTINIYVNELKCCTFVY